MSESTAVHLDEVWAEFLRLRREYHAARDELILRYMSFAWGLADLARRRLPARVAIEQVRSEAHLGLMQAIDRYDGRIPFEAYARRRIIGAIGDWVRTEKRLSNVSLDDLLAENDES